MPSKIILGIAALIIVIAGLAGIAYMSEQKTPNDTTEPSTIILDSSTTTGKGPGYTITQLPDGPTLAEIAPGLNRATVFGAGVPADVRARVNEHIATDIAALKIDNTQPGQWLDLALWYHTAGDFAGARAIWEFLIKAAPSDTTSYDNLGRMYHFDTQDFAKSESYFKQSIAINPKAMAPYVELFELYRLSYKTNTTLAVDTVHVAEKIFPQEPALPLLLAGYYRDLGKVSEARAEYVRALDLARAANNMTLVASINESISNLPK